MRCTSSERQDAQTVVLLPVEDVVRVTSVPGRICLLRDDGGVACTTKRSLPELEGIEPKRVRGLPPIIDLVARGFVTAALGGDGRVFAWEQPRPTPENPRPSPGAVRHVTTFDGAASIELGAREFGPSEDGWAVYAVVDGHLLRHRESGPSAAKTTKRVRPAREPEHLQWPPSPTGIRIDLEPVPGTWAESPVGGWCISGAVDGDHWYNCGPVDDEGAATFSQRAGAYRVCRHDGSSKGIVECAELCRFTVSPGEVLEVTNESVFPEPPGQGIHGQSVGVYPEGERVPHPLVVCAGPPDTPAVGPVAGLKCVRTDRCGTYQLPLETGEYRLMFANVDKERTFGRQHCWFVISEGVAFEVDRVESRGPDTEGNCPPGAIGDPVSPGELVQAPGADSIEPGPGEASPSDR